MLLRVAYHVGRVYGAEYLPIRRWHAAATHDAYGDRAWFLAAEGFEIKRVTWADAALDRTAQPVYTRGTADTA